MPDDSFSLVPPHPLPPEKPKRGKILAWALIILLAGITVYFTKDYFLSKFFAKTAVQEKARE